MKEKVEANVSPVNFFAPDYRLYPLFAEIERRYTVILNPGDCIYIPSFYFHQYVGRPPNYPEKDGVKPNAITVTLKYPSNSAYLSAFFDAIENKVLT